MRVVLDTNVLVSALLVGSGPPGAVYRAWRQGSYSLLVSREQLQELRHTLRKPALACRIRPYKAGQLVNELKRLAEDTGPLPRVTCSSDPDDNFLLGMVEAGRADYLVTGDKSGLLVLLRYAGARILTVRQFATLLPKGSKIE